MRETTVTTHSSARGLAAIQGYHLLPCITTTSTLLYPSTHVPHVPHSTHLQSIMPPTHTTPLKSSSEVVVIRQWQTSETAVQ